MQQVHRRQIAHFRYVDDHTVLSPNFDSLKEWLNDYAAKLKELTGCRLKNEKTEPQLFRLYLQSVNTPAKPRPPPRSIRHFLSHL